MGIMWALFVPRGVSVSSFILLALTGPLVVIVASSVWSANRPLPSARQTRVDAQAAKSMGRGRT
jgi:hypothetical protein